ncbi:MAG: HEAT repeat domain-containing protein, partial [Planctomycetota bacterium]
WAKAAGEKEQDEVKEEKVKTETMAEVEEIQARVVEEKPSNFKKYIVIGIGVFILLGGIGAVLIKLLKDRSGGETYYEQDDEYVSESEEDPFSEDIDEPQTVQSLINNLLDEDPLVRENAAVNLGQTGDKQAIKPLAKALKDQEQSIRKAAKESLIQVLIKALDDQDPRSRAMAAKALGQIGDKRSINPLIKTLKDKDQTVRTAAKEGLALIKKKVGPEEWSKIVKKEHKTLPK